MTVSWARAAVAVLATALALALPSAAWADTNATINPGNVPTTAEDFDTHMCEANFGGGPYPDQDVWVFVLPDNTRDFVSVTADYDTDDDGTADTSLTAPADGGISPPGPSTSKAWIIAPAGWTLISATAVVTGDAPPDGRTVQFNLTHTCPASGSPSPSPSTTSPSPSPSTSPSESGSPSPSPSESESTPPTPSETPSETTPAPMIGPDTGGGGTNMASGYLLGGGSLLAAVVAVGLLMMARRRRDLA